MMQRINWCTYSVIVNFSDVASASVEQKRLRISEGMVLR